MQTSAHDPVNHPSHYTSGKIEVLDFIEDQKFNFKRGQVVKYVARAGRKDPSKEIEDLRKAKFYLDREIAKMEAALVPQTPDTSHVMDAITYATTFTVRKSNAARSAAARKAANARWNKRRTKRLKRPAWTKRRSIRLRNKK